MEGIMFAISAALCAGLVLTAEVAGRLKKENAKLRRQLLRAKQETDRAHKEAEMTAHLSAEELSDLREALAGSKVS